MEIDMKVLETYVYDTTKSIALMDQFEGNNKEKILYDQILVKNEFCMLLEGKYLRYQLVIERRKYEQETSGDITFTNFKKGNVSALREHIKMEIEEKNLKDYVGTDKVYRFNIPYKLRAQNSSNRTGYGWEWDWTGGYGTYTEGTLYGETTDYVFVGIKVLNVTSISSNRCE